MKASERLERTRINFKQNRTPAYGDCLHALRKLENELAEAKLENGLLKIELEHKGRLLNSCETALRKQGGL